MGKRLEQTHHKRSHTVVSLHQTLGKCSLIPRWNTIAYIRMTIMKAEYTSVGKDVEQLKFRLFW